MQYAKRADPVVQYDGTNRVEIVNYLTGGGTGITAVDVTAEAEGKLSLVALIDGQWEWPQELTVGDWATPEGPISAADFAARWVLVE